MGEAKELRGRVAIVTGAAQGIGERIAEFLARDGCSVMLSDIQREKVQMVAKELSTQDLRVDSSWVDVSNPEAADGLVAHTISRFGSVDILVNNAGIDAPLGQAWALPVDHWREIIDVDLDGAWWCTRAVIPHMISRKYGRIMFISSVSARAPQLHISVAYDAAKAGLIGLAVGLSRQLEAHGILVNAIMPGPTGTGRPMTEDDRIAQAQFPLSPAGPDPIAHACLYLARASGDWISGSLLNVSGGRVRG
jgi:NAD(P)-dependent dehydrogenase (short-subunit alcohol dehydrogenase family)